MVDVDNRKPYALFLGMHTFINYNFYKMPMEISKDKTLNFTCAGAWNSSKINL